MLEEQALRMSTWSRSLNKDWVNEQQHRMNVRGKRSSYAERSALLDIYRVT